MFARALPLPRPARTVCTVIWFSLASLCTGQALAQASEGPVAWISAQEHQRVILPKRTQPQAAQEAQAVEASADISSGTPVARTASETAVEQLLKRPMRVARNSKRFTPEMQAMLERASRHFAVDAHLVKAVIHAESAFNPRAVSPKNAIGLMQVLPSTARDLGLQDLEGRRVEQLMTDPRVSIVLGTKYLAEQLARFGGNVELAVAAYNAGPGAVLKAGHRVPNYPETQHYVRRVLSLAQAYRRAGQQGEPA
jgi:soluble lytic murein transglycosylase-like protein